MYWHRWFAWRPVVITDRAGRRQLVWLENVERKWTEGTTSGCPWREGLNIRLLTRVSSLAADRASVHEMIAKYPSSHNSPSVTK
jgi:hypothetical protein